jgi:hypothetical protein
MAFERRPGDLRRSALPSRGWWLSALIVLTLAVPAAGAGEGHRAADAPRPATGRRSPRVAGAPLFGTRHTPNNRPISDWAPGIRAHYGVKSIVDARATADLQAGIGLRWGAPYVVFKQDSYAIYYAREGDPEYRVTDQDGNPKYCPLDRGAGYAGVRVPADARVWVDGAARRVADGVLTADDDFHFTVVDAARNRVYGFYMGSGTRFGVKGGRLRTPWRSCDLLHGDDAAIEAASAAPRRYRCGGGRGYPVAGCGLAGIGAGVSAGGPFGNGDSNGFMGPHGVIVPQDFDDEGWTGEAVGTLHHALRCSTPAAYQHGYVWPMQDPGAGARGRHLRDGQIIRLDPSFDVSATGAPPYEQRLMRTLQVYGCVLSDYATYGMALFALSAWPGTGVRRDGQDPWTAAGGANAEAQAFHAGADRRGVRFRVLPHMSMRALQVVLPHGAAHPPR